MLAHVLVAIYGGDVAMSYLYPNVSSPAFSASCYNRVSVFVIVFLKKIKIKMCGVI